MARDRGIGSRGPSCGRIVGRRLIVDATNGEVVIVEERLFDQARGLFFVMERGFTKLRDYPETWKTLDDSHLLALREPVGVRQWAHFEAPSAAATVLPPADSPPTAPIL